MAKFLRVVKESDLNQTEAVGDFTADPAQQARMYLQYHTGMFDPATLPKFMTIAPGVSLSVQPPPPGSSGSHAETLAYLSAANKKLPKDLQVGYDELKMLGGVSDTIELTGEPHPDKYNPATDPTDANPVATPFKVQENSLDKFLSIVRKNDVGILNEASNPHKVSLPVQMAMHHYQQPSQLPVSKPSMLKSYFQEVEVKHLETVAEKKQLMRQYASEIAERVMIREAVNPAQQAAIAIAKKKKKGVAETWSQKYKSSINCSHPKGFSQKAHCAGKKKHNEDITMESVCPDCGMCETHGSLNEIAKGAKDSNGFTKCWPGKHAAGTKKGKNGGQVRNCVPNEGVAEATGDPKFDKMLKDITGKRAVAKQQKTDTGQQARAAFGGMFGGGNPADKLGIRKPGVAEERTEKTAYPNATVIKSKNGRPIGEIYQDEPYGWGCFHYGADNGADSMSSREQALAQLKDMHDEYRQQGVAESAQGHRMGLNPTGGPGMGNYIVDEMPLDFNKDAPASSTVHNHQGANPGSIEYRIMRARRQLQELAKDAESSNLAVWESISRHFPELAMNIEQIRHGIEELAKIKKGGGRRSANIPSGLGEVNAIKEANAKKKTLKNSNPCWKGYHPVGTKQKSGRTVPNCVPKKK